MANLSISYGEKITCLGIGPTTKWGVTSPNTMAWGSTKWGEGTQPAIWVFNLNQFVESIPSVLNVIDQFHLVLNSDAIATDLLIDQGAETDGGVWDYVFPSNTVFPAQQVSTQYADGTAPVTTFTSGSAPTTNWN